jgi:hypothetical protein
MSSEGIPILLPTSELARRAGRSAMTAAMWLLRSGTRPVAELHEGSKRIPLYSPDVLARLRGDNPSAEPTIP